MIDAPERPASPKQPLLRFGLIPRILALVFLFAIELVVLSIWLDNASLISQGGVVATVGRSGAWAVRGIVGFAALFFTFAYLQKSPALGEISREMEEAPMSRGLFAAYFSAHVAMMGTFGFISWGLYGHHLRGFSPEESVAAWLVTGLSGIALAALAVIPFPTWKAMVRATGTLWLFSAIAVIVACVVGAYSRSAWTPLVGLTFTLTKALLSLFVPQVIAIPAQAILGTPKFRVEIAPECSGFEGAGLILAFGAAWLWMFRKECRFPHALLLLPAGVVAIFLMNTVRITALILIGNAGARDIAVGGFHSQAGWIAFNIVALGLAVAARKLAWFNNVPSNVSSNVSSNTPGGVALVAPSVSSPETASGNPAETYLAPFLIILVVGMLATAASGGFEWLYPLRFVAVVGVLWMYRARYRAMDWKFGWFGIAMGVLVFALWMGCDFALNKTSNDAMPKALAAASWGARTTWIAFRALAAIVTVPIAEELAFRGFAIRRFISEDIEALPASSYTWIGLATSSVAFGLMHGNMWFAGILAGVCYAWALLRRGRIGEAVIAHATTNALLAAYVLYFQKWHLW